MSSPSFLPQTFRDGTFRDEITPMLSVVTGWRLFRLTRSLMYHVIYETKGYWFRTPEAWDITGNYRAGMYMRPVAIWALEMTPGRGKE